MSGRLLSSSGRSSPSDPPFRSAASPTNRWSTTPDISRTRSQDDPFTWTVLLSAQGRSSIWWSSAGTASRLRDRISQRSTSSWRGRTPDTPSTMTLPFRTSWLDWTWTTKTCPEVLAARLGRWTHRMSGAQWTTSKHFSAILRMVPPMFYERTAVTGLLNPPIQWVLRFKFKWRKI